ncbi:MAG: hypothetical protein AAB551_02770 [Patescibacteria group bacterium]
MASRKKIIPAAFLGLLLLAGCSDALGDRYVGFAQCLTDKGATMYGAYWCPHCENQKKPFGKQGFEKVKYVECAEGGPSANPALCAQKGVKSYPTWIFADGTKITGEQELTELAVRTSCVLPKEETEETTEAKK